MKSKVSNREMQTYLQERKASLKKELKEIEDVLGVMEAGKSAGKSAPKKGKKKDRKKKLAKVAKAIRKKGREAEPHLADKPANASAVTTVPAVVTDQPVFGPSGTMDEKIRYALNQKRNSTKEELIECLNGLDPDYGLSKLRKVVAFRLTYLVKAGKIKAKESKAGIRYANP